MSEKVKIGTWQGPFSGSSIEENLGKIRSVLTSSEADGLDFLCFPELCLSGSSRLTAKSNFAAKNDPRIAEFVHSTKSCETVILVGLAEQMDGQVYNSQLVIFKGELLGVAHKMSLAPQEERHFSKDTAAIPVFQAKGIRFGVLIGRDSEFIEPALYLRLKGVRLLFTPDCDAYDAEQFGDHRSLKLNQQGGLATLLNSIVVRSNIVALDQDGLSAGDSYIWGINGETIAQGKPFTECLVSGEIDRSLLTQEHRSVNPGKVAPNLYSMIGAAARNEHASGQQGVE